MSLAINPDSLREDVRKAEPLVSPRRPSSSDLIIDGVAAKAIAQNEISQNLSAQEIVFDLRAKSIPSEVPTKTLTIPLYSSTVPSQELRIFVPSLNPKASGSGVVSAVTETNTPLREIPFSQPDGPPPPIAFQPMIDNPRAASSVTETTPFLTRDLSSSSAEPIEALSRRPSADEIPKASLTTPPPTVTQPMTNDPTHTSSVNNQPPSLPPAPSQNLLDELNALDQENLDNPISEISSFSNQAPPSPTTELIFVGLDNKKYRAKSTTLDLKQLEPLLKELAQHVESRTVTFNIFKENGDQSFRIAPSIQLKNWNDTSWDNIYKNKNIYSCISYISSFYKLQSSDLDKIPSPSPALDSEDDDNDSQSLLAEPQTPSRRASLLSTPPDATLSIEPSDAPNN